MEINITLNKLIFEWAFGDIPGGIFNMGNAL
jgi:hypothetical protein